MIPLKEYDWIKKRSEQKYNTQGVLSDTVERDTQYKLSSNESWAIKWPADWQHCNQRYEEVHLAAGENGTWTQTIARIVLCCVRAFENWNLSAI